MQEASQQTPHQGSIPFIKLQEQNNGEVKRKPPMRRVGSTDTKNEGSQTLLDLRNIMGGTTSKSTFFASPRKSEELQKLSGGNTQPILKNKRELKKGNSGPISQKYYGDNNESVSSGGFAAHLSKTQNLNRMQTLKDKQASSGVTNGNQPNRHMRRRSAFVNQDQVKFSIHQDRPKTLSRFTNELDSLDDNLSSNKKKSVRFEDEEENGSFSPIDIPNSFIQAPYIVKNPLKRQFRRTSFQNAMNLPGSEYRRRSVQVEDNPVEEFEIPNQPVHLNTIKEIKKGGSARNVSDKEKLSMIQQQMSMRRKSEFQEDRLMQIQRQVEEAERKLNDSPPMDGIILNSSESDDENLPYPYNKIPEERWKQLRKYIKEQQKEESSNVPFKSKVFAARILSLMDEKKKRAGLEISIRPLDTIRKIQLIEEMAKDSGSSRDNFKVEEIKITNQSPMGEGPIDELFESQQKQKTLLEDYQCNPILQKKWKKSRNVLIAILRLNKIMKDILNYGTTYKMFNIKKRELSQVRDFMLPDIKIKKSIREKNMRSKEERTLQNTSTDLIRILRLPRLYRLLRMARLIKLIKILKKTSVYHKISEMFHISTNGVRLISFFITVLLFTHLAGCMWILVAQINDFSPDTWVFDQNLQDANNFSIYLAALYWALYTLLTVGYGDIRTKTNGKVSQILQQLYLEEMLMACCWIIVGGSFFTFTIGKLSSVLSSMNTRESQINDKKNVIQQFSNQTGIDRKLKDKLVNAVVYVTRKNFLWTDKKEIFDELPAQLRSEVAREMHFGIVKQIRFFDDKDNNFIGSIVPLLTPLKVGIHEIIYRKGNHPNAIFFITKGRVSFFVEKKNVAFKDTIQGGYFGDIDIILRRPRQYTVIAVEESDFLTLSRQTFEQVILREYPDVFEEMELVGFEREKMIRQAKKIALQALKKFEMKQGPEARNSEIIKLGDLPEQILMREELPEEELFDIIQNNQELKEEDAEQMVNPKSLQVVKDYFLQKQQGQPFKIQPQRMPQSIEQKQGDLSEIHETAEHQDDSKNSTQHQPIEIEEEKIDSEKSIESPRRSIYKNYGLASQAKKTSKKSIEETPKFEFFYLQNNAEPIEQKLGMMDSSFFEKDDNNDDEEQEGGNFSGHFSQLKLEKDKLSLVENMSQRSGRSAQTMKMLQQQSTFKDNKSAFYEPKVPRRSYTKLPNQIDNLGFNKVLKVPQQMHSFKTLNEDDEDIMNTIKQKKMIFGALTQTNLLQFQQQNAKGSSKIIEQMEHKGSKVQSNSSLSDESSNSKDSESSDQTVSLEFFEIQASKNISKRKQQTTVSDELLTRKKNKQKSIKIQNDSYDSFNSDEEELFNKQLEMFQIRTRQSQKIPLRARLTQILNNMDRGRTNTLTNPPVDLPKTDQEKQQEIEEENQLKNMDNKIFKVKKTILQQRKGQIKMKKKIENISNNLSNIIGQLSQIKDQMGQNMSKSPRKSVTVVDSPYVFKRS